MGDSDSEHDETVESAQMASIIDSDIEKLIRNSEERTSQMYKFELEKLGNSLKKQFRAVTQKCAELETSIKQKDARIEQLERTIKRNNIIVYGLKEAAKETFEERSACITDLGRLLSTHIDFSEAFRIGKPKQDANRPLLIKFLRYRDKIAILEAAREAKLTGVSISDDMTVTERKIRSALVIEKKRVKEGSPAAVCKIRGNRLFVQADGETKTIYTCKMQKTGAVVTTEPQGPRLPASGF